MIPTVEELLETMQDAAREISSLNESLIGRNAFSLESRNIGQEIAFLFGQLHEAKAQLDRLGVQVKDIESGTVDFPSKLGAEVVWLSWEKGQDAITHYHRVGDSSTKPLPQDLWADHHGAGF